MTTKNSFHKSEQKLVKVHTVIKINSNSHIQDDLSLDVELYAVFVFKLVKPKRVLQGPNKLGNLEFFNSHIFSTSELCPYIWEFIKVFAKLRNHIIFRQIIPVKLFKCNEHKKIKDCVAADQVETHEEKQGANGLNTIWVAIRAIIWVYSVCIHITPVFTSSHAEQQKHCHPKILKAEIPSCLNIDNLSSYYISE